MSEELYKKITKREEDFSALHKRMQDDEELLLLKPYKMKDADDKELDHVLSVTCNDPQTFGKTVTGNIKGCKRQTIIKGQNVNPNQRNTIETFLREDLHEAIDERLRIKDLDYASTLYDYEADHISYRGRIGTRVLAKAQGTDKIIVDILPIDARYLVYQTGYKGLEWAAWRDELSKEEILDQYNIDKTKLRDGLNPVHFAYDTENEYVFIGKKAESIQPHNLGYVPIVIQRSWLGSSLKGKDSLKNTGEGIFMSNRALYPKKNQLASILSNLNMQSFLGAYQIEGEPGQETPDYPVTAFRMTWMTPKGTEWKLVPIRDITNAARWEYSLIDSCLQRGGLPNVAFGNLTFPLSAVAIKELTAVEDQLYIPLMQPLALFERNLHKMIILQITEGHVNADLGGDWQPCAIPIDDLKRDFILFYKFSPQQPMKKIANFSIGGAAQPFIPNRVIVEDIIEVDDPSAIIREKLSEELEELVPPLKLWRGAQALDEIAKQAKGEEKEKLTAEADIIYAYLMTSFGISREGPQQQPKQKQQPLVPLFPKGGGRATPQKQAAELGTTLEAEEVA